MQAVVPPVEGFRFDEMAARAQSIVVVEVRRVEGIQLGRASVQLFLVQVDEAKVISWRVPGLDDRLEAGPGHAFHVEAHVRGILHGTSPL